MKKNHSIVNPDLYNLINKNKKVKIDKEFKIPQPLYKKIVLKLKKFFLSLK